MRAVILYIAGILAGLAGWPSQTDKINLSIPTAGSCSLTHTASDPDKAATAIAGYRVILSTDPSETKEHGCSAAPTSEDEKEKKSDFEIYGMMKSTRDKKTGNYYINSGFVPLIKADKRRGSLMVVLVALDPTFPDAKVSEGVAAEVVLTPSIFDPFDHRLDRTVAALTRPKGTFPLLTPRIERINPHPTGIIFHFDSLSSKTKNAPIDLIRFLGSDTRFDITINGDPYSMTKEGYDHLRGCRTEFVRRYEGLGYQLSE